MRLTLTDGTRMRDKSQTRTTLKRSAADQALDRAIQRVYEVYGPDLTQFFAAVQRQRAERLQGSLETREETNKKRT